MDQIVADQYGPYAAIHRWQRQHDIDLVITVQRNLPDVGAVGKDQIVGRTVLARFTVVLRTEKKP